MKFSKLGLLTLLISLFILSCKQQDGIGLGIDQSNQLNGTLFADTNLTLTTVAEDTVQTSALFRTPLSYFKDPEFGTTESNIAAALTLPGGSAYTVPTGTNTIDSVRLVLPYASTGFYGDSLTSKYKIDVHQLNEKYVSQVYYNTKQWNYNSAILGTKTFTARSHDTIRIFDIIKGKPDTLKKAAPQIRIAIDPSFAKEYVFNAPTTYLASPLGFQNAVKGLYLTLDKSATTGPGGNLMFQMDSARVNIYFRTVNGTTTDTSMISLPVPAGTHAASIKHAYTAKVQAALNGTSTDGLVYLEGLGGTRAKVTFPNIKNIFASIGSDAIINRAELVVTAAPGTTIPYTPTTRLTMYQLDLAKQRVRLQDAATSDPRGINGPSFFGAFYNSKNNEYHFLVTAFIQDLIRGKTVDYGTYIAPVDGVASSTINILPTATFAERVIIPGKNSPYRIKLNIIYTKINQ